MKDLLSEVSVEPLIQYFAKLIPLNADEKFDRIFRVLIENSFIKLQERLLQTISSSAEERYQSFINTYPHLINRLPQIQVASFLGITPEFLSRLRHRQANTAGTKS